MTWARWFRCFCIYARLLWSDFDDLSTQAVVGLLGSGFDVDWLLVRSELLGSRVEGIRLLFLRRFSNLARLRLRIEPLEYFHLLSIPRPLPV